MDLERQLLAQFATDHPAEVASALAAMSHQEAALVLDDLGPAAAASLLHYLPSLSAALALEQLSVEEAAAILTAVRPDIAAAILRTTPSERRAAVVACFPPRLQTAIANLLIYAEDTAGALMTRKCSPHSSWSRCAKCSRGSSTIPRTPSTIST